MGTVPPSLALDMGDLGIEPGDSANVLLLVPAMDVRDDIACAELCTLAQPEELDLVVVTIDQTPAERLTVWRTHASCDLPVRTAMVSVNDTDRAAAADLEAEEESATIATISDPNDLSELGIRTSDHLSEWADSGNPTALCFHSLTALLGYVDTQRAFRFLQVLRGRLEGSNVVAHYHMDPAEHDEETVSTIRATMDVVAELDEDGAWSISRP